MEKRELLIIRNSTIITVGKKEENEKIRLFFEKKGCHYNHFQIQDLSESSFKRVVPDIIYYCENNLDTIKFLKKVLPKAYIIHYTKEEDPAYLKKSTNFGTSYFIDSLDEKSVSDSLQIPLKTLQIDRHVLSTSKNFQKITNNLNEIIFITDGEKTVWGNKEFNEFFSVSTLNEFNQTTSVLPNIFLQRAGYLSFKEGEDWIKTLESVPEETKKVAVQNQSGNVETFLISIADFSVVPMKKIITLHRVSSKMLENSSLVRKQTKSWQKALDTLDIEIIRTNRYKTIFTAIYIDVMERFNIKEQPAEDKEIAASYIYAEILEILRHTDYCIQMGPSQFILIATHTDTLQSEKLCKRLIENLEGTKESLIEKYQVRFAITGYKPQDEPLKILKRLNHQIKSTTTKNPYEIIKV